MIEQRRGCIIAVSSIAARYFIESGMGAHSTAKSGLDAFVKSLAVELGPHGIRVNAVAPGVTLTDALSSMPQDWINNVAQQTPLRRNGTPKDVAGAILMLAMEAAGFVTGTYLMVNGGGWVSISKSSVNRIACLILFVTSSGNSPSLRSSLSSSDRRPNASALKKVKSSLLNEGDIYNMCNDEDVRCYSNYRLSRVKCSSPQLQSAPKTGSRLLP